MTEQRQSGCKPIPNTIYNEIPQKNYKGEKTMKNVTPELIAKAKTAQNTEELRSLARTNGIDLTEAEANVYYEQLHANGALSDDELNAVSGGLGCPDDGEENDAKAKLIPGKKVRVLNGKICPKCHSNEGVIGHNLTASGMTGNTLYVFCPKCNMKITDYVSNDTVELI
jgi:DNA-directed RNA polymerase subunit M/transcription elongation factor TFIIS